MSEPQREVGSASTLEGPTAAQIKEQIAEKQRELKAAAAAKPVAPAPEPTPIPASVPPEPAPAPFDANKPPQAAPESGADGVPGPTGNDKPEWKKWIEKKGFKGPEDMVRSMRELERELHSRGRGNGADAPQPALPEPPIQPRQPSYAPPALSLEELAKRYNMDPSDLERVAPLAADIAANQVARVMAPLQAEVQSLRRDTARNAEFQGLKEDPAFADPRVQFEMHQILRENPSILQNEPAPYRYAFNEALRTMGRRILEGSITPDPQAPPVSGPPGMPIAPPRTAGGGGSGSGAPSGIRPTGRISQDEFNRLPAAEQRKILSRMGLVNEQEV